MLRDKTHPYSLSFSEEPVLCPIPSCLLEVIFCFAYLYFSFCSLSFTCKHVQPTTSLITPSPTAYALPDIVFSLCFPSWHQVPQNNALPSLQHSNMSFIPWFYPGQFSTSDQAKVTFMSPYHQILLDLLPTTPSLKFRSSSPGLTIASLLTLFSPLDSMSSSKALISSTQITLLSLPLPTLSSGFLFSTLSLFTPQTLPGQFHVDTSQAARLSMPKTAAATTFPQTSLLLPLQLPLFWLTAPLSEQFESCVKVRVSFFNLFLWL